MRAHRPLPPYGRRVTEALHGNFSRFYGTQASGRGAQIIIAVGSNSMAWPPRHLRTLAVAVPPGEDPAGFRWDWAAEHAPALIVPVPSAERTVVRQTAAALLRDGAEYAVGVLPDGWVRFERGRAVA